MVKKNRNRLGALPIAVLALALILSGCSKSNDAARNDVVNNVVDDTPEIDPYETYVLPESEEIVVDEEPSLEDDVVELEAPPCTMHSGKDLRGKDLSGRDMTGIDLTGADMRKVKAIGTIFTNAILRCTDWRGAILFGIPEGSQWVAAAKFDGSDLSYSNIEGVPLFNQYVGVTFSGANLSYAQAEGQEFRVYAMLNVNFDYAKLRRSIFNCYDLCQYEGSFNGSDLSYVKLDYLEPSGSTSFNDAIMVGASMQKGKIHAPFVGADVSKMKFNNSEFDGIDLTDAITDGTVYAGVKWTDATCPDGTSSRSSDNLGECAA